MPEVHSAFNRTLILVPYSPRRCCRSGESAEFRRPSAQLRRFERGKFCEEIRLSLYCTRAADNSWQSSLCAIWARQQLLDADPELSMRSALTVAAMKGAESGPGIKSFDRQGGK